MNRVCANRPRAPAHLRDNYPREISNIDVNTLLRTTENIKCCVECRITSKYNHPTLL